MSSLKNLDFDWSAIKVALEGHSFLDVAKLNVTSRSEARQFLLAYGYDIEDPLVRNELIRIYFESVAFLRSQLLEPGEEIPPELVRRGPATDLERLILLASTKSDEGRWACAILRVMHIISHLDNDVRLENFQTARAQIFERFDDYLQPISPRRWKFGKGSDYITLVRYIKKERKDRNSTIIKLLSKPHAFVEEIYDRIGFRFVTETKLDALRLLQLMFDLGVVSPPNVHPGRSINSLVSLDMAQATIESTREHLETGRVSQRNSLRRLQRIEDISAEPISSSRNPYSSHWYRAIQFTCRQLIMAQDPTFRFWSELKRDLAKVRGFNTALKQVPITLRERRTFYYPFEIQILDKLSYVESIGGRSRHREYKARQKAMARARVLGELAAK